MAPHVMPLWPGPGVEVQEAGTGAGYAPGRSPLTAHTSQSGRVKPAMPGSKSVRVSAARAVDLAGVYRNSPEMRLTEPATMTTPNT